MKVWEQWLVLLERCGLEVVMAFVKDMEIGRAHV